GRAPAVALIDHAHDVGAGYLDHRLPAGADGAVGGEDHEVVGQARHGDALVGLELLGGEVVPELEAVAAVDRLVDVGGRVEGHPVAHRRDHRVDGPFHAVHGAQAG